MSRERGDAALAVSLALVAGYVDAVGYLQLGHLFLSFMSGNTTQFGIATARLDWRGANAPAAIIAAFVAGVVLGGWLGGLAGRWRRPLLLGIEALLLGSVCVPVLPFNVVVILMTTTMGLQNAVMHHAGGEKVSLTYMTGMLVRFGEKIAGVLLGRDRLADAALELALWLGFLTGAACGVVGFNLAGLVGMTLPAGVLGLLSLTTLVAMVRRSATSRSAG